MKGDARIEKAIEIGKKNKRTMELVHNWCAHVSMRKHGGVGLVEIQTGLPIGHHFLECPHAPAGGMAAWDLAETAIDFYDRNCVDCKFRKPVGLPNIMSLVTERDARRAKQRLEQETAEKEVADRLAAREATRKALRSNLETMAATTLDQISELDRDRSEEAGHRLVQTAALAPETFPPPVVEHLFSLIDANEYRLVEPSLSVLAKLPVDKGKLCNAALRALRSYNARDTAAAIVKDHCEHADERWIKDALPALIGLAMPIHYSFGPSGRQHPNTAPIRALYKAHKNAVRNGLKVLLEDKDADDVRRAARGIEVLADQDPTILDFLAVELVSKVARSNWLVQGREEDVTDALNDIRHTLRRVFEAKPNETDSLIGQYLVGARPENAAELYHVYDDVLRDVRFSRNREETPEITDAHRLAFRRIVVAAGEATSEEVFDAVGRLFHGDPYELTPLAAEEVDLLLGTAALIDAKLDEVENDNERRNDPLHAIHQMNRRSALANRAQSFINWACIGARASGTTSVNKVLAFLRGLPENSDRLRGLVVGNYHVLMGNVETLPLCLPDYYSALVGSSQLERSNAATALGELRHATRQNLPTLVFEAFAALLADPYVIVHQAAVRALRDFKLPPEFDAIAKQAFSNIILAYANKRDADEFLMRAIDLYARRYATPEMLSGGLGSALIDIMNVATPYIVAKEIRSLGKRFVGNSDYPAVLFRLFKDEQAMSIYEEDLLETVTSLPPSVVFRERAQIVEAGKGLLGEYRYAVPMFIEALTAAGAWNEAEELARAAFDKIEDTIRNRPIRLQAGLRLISCSYEAAIAAAHPEKLEDLRNRWNSTLAAIEADREAHRDRRDPLRGLLGAR